MITVRPENIDFHENLDIILVTYPTTAYQEIISEMKLMQHIAKIRTS